MGKLKPWEVSQPRALACLDEARSASLEHPTGGHSMCVPPNARPVGPQSWPLQPHERFGLFFPRTQAPVIPEAV